MAVGKRVVGQYRHRVEIQELVQYQDGSGNVVEEWETYTGAWAKISNLQGRQYWDAKQAQSEATGEIRTRYIEGVRPSMRIKHGERVYEIESVFDPDERGEQLLFLVKERLGNG